MTPEIENTMKQEVSYLVYINNNEVVVEECEHMPDGIFSFKTKNDALKDYIQITEKRCSRAKKLIAQAKEMLDCELTQEEQDRVLNEDTQQYRIYKYLEEHGSITPLDAYNDLGITKLATRISEMRAKGFAFRQKRESGKNRYNEDVSYMRYWLEG